MKRLVLPLVAGLLHALLMGLACAPVAWWPAALVAILPLVWAALRAERVLWKDALAVCLGASPFYWYQQQWVFEISSAGYVPLVVYLTVYPGLFVIFLNRLVRAFPRTPLTLLVPIAWTGLEWLRGEVVWDGYAWFLLAHPLIDCRPMSISGSAVGAYGVGAFIAAYAGFSFDLLGTIRPSTRTARSPRVLVAIACTIVIAGAQVALSLVCSSNAATASGEPQLRIGIVQTNVPQSNKVAWTFEQRKADLSEFLAQTRRAAESKPSLIVWPETMFPGGYLQTFEDIAPGGKSLGTRTTSMATGLLDFQRSLGIPMLVGALGADGLRLEADREGSFFKSDRRYNSVFLVDQGQTSPLRYDKIRLTPFGETMPYISYWPWLQDKLLALGASGMSFDLAMGSPDRIGAFEFAPTVPSVGATRPEIVRIVTPICFEITESSLCRKLVNRAAQARARVLIANLTNDGWFGSFDPARQQHQLAARWRSLELGVPVIRSANTGISSITEFGGENRNRLIDVSGRSARVAGVMVDNVTLFRGTTIFRQVGDLCWTFTLLLGAGLIVAFRRGKPNNPAEGASTTSTHGGRT